MQVFSNLTPWKCKVMLDKMAKFYLPWLKRGGRGRRGLLHTDVSLVHPIKTQQETVTLSWWGPLTLIRRPYHGCWESCLYVVTSENGPCYVQLEKRYFVAYFVGGKRGEGLVYYNMSQTHSIWGIYLVVFICLAICYGICLAICHDLDLDSLDILY